MSAVTNVGVRDYGRATREQHGVITVKVIYNVDKTEIFFRIRTDVQLGKLMTAYCERRDLNIRYLRFLFNGAVIKPHQTPIKLGMEDRDEIDCMMEVGGGGYAHGNCQT